MILIKLGFLTFWIIKDVVVKDKDKVLVTDIYYRN